MPKTLIPTTLLTEENLRKAYCDDGLTIAQCMKVFGVGENTILRRMKLWSIAGRRPGPMSGKKHPNWKGGKTHDKSGYILVHCPDHPRANRCGYVREHRLVAEQMIGRHLEKGEVVHHINEDRSDNRPENLQVFRTNADHLAATLAGKCPNWSEDGRARIVQGKKIPMPPIDELLLMHEQIGIRATAKKLGYSEGALRRQLRSIGAKLTGPGMRDKYKWPDEPEFRRMLGEIGVQGIMRLVGSSEPSVYSRMKKYGIPTPKRSVCRKPRQPIPNAPASPARDAQAS